MKARSIACYGLGVCLACGATDGTNQPNVAASSGMPFGTSGAAGASGAAGLSGTAGLSGAAGAAGASSGAISGSVTGATGTSSSGAAGSPTGRSGSSGAAGTATGASGTAGTQTGSSTGAASGIVDAGPLFDALAPPPDPCIKAGTCPVGSWVNVTPAGVNLGVNVGCAQCNYGAQDVVADPVRPGDFYAFICYQGVWKSTDYGSTWTKVDTGTNASHLESGRPWTAAIDPNPHRDPNTKPVLYTVSGYGDLLGVYKSTDGGVNWTNYAVGNTQAMIPDDVYSLDIDPGNTSHIIAGFHDLGLSESMDGGQTWKTIHVPANFGLSAYAWFVNTGSAATTSTTWLTMAQWNNDTDGMWRTTNSGTTWTHVQPTLEHGHGSTQIYQDGKGMIYAGGNTGTNTVIYRSADYGQTWQAASSNSVPQNGVFGTPNYVYATLSGAFQDGQQQHLQRARTSDGLNWSDWAPIAPSGMTDGAKRAAITYDGQHYIIVTGNWLAGIWRYVE